MIRDDSHTLAAAEVKGGRAVMTYVWFAVLAGLVIFAFVMCAVSVRAGALTAAILSGGTGLIGCLLALLLPRSRSVAERKDQISEMSGTAVDMLLSSTDSAAVYVRSGHPVKANNDYYALARQFSAEASKGILPSLDRIFVVGGEEVQATLFALDRSPRDGLEHRKSVHFFQDDIFYYFDISVINRGDDQFWQVTDKKRDLSHQHSLLAQAPIGLFSTDSEGRVLASNPNLDRWLGNEWGYKPDHISEFIEDPECLLDSPRDGHRIVRAETRLVTRKNVITPVVLNAEWREIEDGVHIAHVAVHGHSSLTLEPVLPTAKNAPGRRADSSADFSGAPIAYAELDSLDLSGARITKVNDAFRKMSGLSEFEEVALSDLFQSGGSGTDITTVDAADCQVDVPVETTFKTGKGLSVSAYIVGDEADGTARIFLVDISTRKSLEDQLVQSQKMQAIGRLVAEIAHDFNNLLAAMRLYTDTLLGRHPIGDPAYPELQQINANINRAAALVKNLLAYSRKQTLRAVKLNVTDTLSDLGVTLRQVLGERAKLNIVHGRDLPAIRMDKNQLDTVLMNLAVNARDAMKAQGGGKITIESSVRHLDKIKDPALKNALTGLSGTEFVRISVADTGTGITDEIKSKIFEPFFTTKPQGEGTGLGLSTVYGIVQQSGGHLDVESKLGVGTTFSVYLPAYRGPDIDQPAEDAKPDPVSPRPARKPLDLAGQGNILFVEDEASVRVIAAKTLRKRGYKVTEAADGEEAYDIIEAAEQPFDLMISDVVMPGMDGPTLLKKARSQLGSARIVFISGYAEEEFSDLLSEEPDVTFLPKPFTLVELAEKVKDEIGESKS